MNIFDQNHYRPILKGMISANPQRGFRGKMARAAKCQPSYLSQVLNGLVHLTPDQAIELGEFFNFTVGEIEYFLALVHFERAANKKLRQFYTNKLEAIRLSQKPLNKKLGAEKELEFHREQYYSAWYYSAIHMLLSIPQFQNIRAIQEKLKLPTELIQKTISLLEQMQLIERLANGWQTVEFNLHVPSQSPLHVSHHLNWRTFAATQIQQGNPESVHYTAVHSLSKKDVEEMRSMIVQFIKDTRKKVEVSKEEELVMLSVDYMTLG